MSFRQFPPYTTTCANRGHRNLWGDHTQIYYNLFRTQHLRCSPCYFAQHTNTHPCPSSVATNTLVPQSRDWCFFQGCNWHFLLVGIKIMLDFQTNIRPLFAWNMAANALRSWELTFCWLGPNKKLNSLPKIDKSANKNKNYSRWLCGSQTERLSFAYNIGIFNPSTHFVSLCVCNSGSNV